ncbi:MAG TPA: MFS transporter [Ignavibacteria bacterium]|nr:MFS transporter [Ignavibacteria bacterium]
MTFQKNNKKVINAWCIYDWANSVYSLVITSAVFPIYFQNITSVKDSGGNILKDTVSFFGFEMINSVLYSYSLSFSFLLIALLSPVLSSIADFSGSKKMFMRIFCYIGSVSCAGLFFFNESTLEFSMIMFVLASVGFSGSIVFYNAYLPEIATEDKFDSISAKGFALGYTGSVILLIFNLTMILFPGFYGINSAGLATRISFLTVGIWWFGFAAYTFHYLPSDIYNKKPEGNYLLNGFKELGVVIRELKKQKLLKSFLLAFFFYNMGVQTVLYLATIFGDKELGLSSELLIATILVLQIVAVGGSYLFSFLSGKIGNIYSLMVSICFWILVSVLAFFITTATEFIFVAGLVGLTMGGIQALSRSTYAKIIPGDTTDHASYFSFYDVSEKVSIVIGTFFYGLINQLTGNMRISSLVLSVFFITGLIFLSRIPSKNIYSVKIKS